MNILCVSASNNHRQGIDITTSMKICQHIVLEAKKILPYANCSIIELRDYSPNPCVNCIKCLGVRRCTIDDAFNEIYEKVIDCSILFVVSPHYAPIPAKLCMVLEKMESISFNPWLNDNNYRSEVYGIPTGVISHGGTGEAWALQEYQHVVNYPIWNALQTIQLKVIPYNDDWKAGISVPTIENAQDSLDSEFSVFADYVAKVIHSYDN